jgi:hypothetical protein
MYANGGPRETLKLTPTVSLWKALIQILSFGLKEPVAADTTADGLIVIFSNTADL